MTNDLSYLEAALRPDLHPLVQVQTQAHTYPQRNASVQQLPLRAAHEHNLSARESEILAWVALGKTNPEIGSILGISAFTVKNHVQRILKKLDVTNRTQAVGKTTALMNHG